MVLLTLAALAQVSQVSLSCRIEATADSTGRKTVVFSQSVPFKAWGGGVARARIEALLFEQRLMLSTDALIRDSDPDTASLDVDIRSEGARANAELRKTPDSFFYLKLLPRAELTSDNERISALELHCSLAD